MSTQKVTNPYTGRLIQVGGATYRKIFNFGFGKKKSIKRDYAQEHAQRRRQLEQALDQGRREEAGSLAQYTATTGQPANYAGPGKTVKFFGA